MYIAFNFFSNNYHRHKFIVLNYKSIENKIISFIHYYNDSWCWYDSIKRQLWEI